MKAGKQAESIKHLSCSMRQLAAAANISARVKRPHREKIEQQPHSSDKREVEIVPDQRRRDRPVKVERKRIASLVEHGPLLVGDDGLENKRVDKDSECSHVGRQDLYPVHSGVLMRVPETHHGCVRNL